MRPSHRLDVLLVPHTPEDAPIDGVRRLLAALAGAGVLADGGRPGPEGARWMSEGFGRLFLDTPGRVTLYANRQGGFRVLCPATHENLVPEWQAALTAWRAGGPRHLACPRCGERHALEDLEGRPPFAFASLALITADARGTSPTPWALEQARFALGPMRTVLRRG